MTSFSTEVQFLFRLLSDEQWHNYKEIAERLAASIAPGKALRKYDVRRERRRGPSTEKDLFERSDDEKIRFGQRLLANAAINGVKVRYLEYQEDENGSRQVRLKPGADVPRSSSPLRAPESTAGEADEDLEESEVTDAPEEPEEPETDKHLDRSLVEAGRFVEVAVETPADVLGPQIPIYADGPPVDSRGQKTAKNPFICMECGSPMADPIRHQAWHKEMEKTAREVALLELEVVNEEVPAIREANMALFSELEVRQIVAQEVGTQLDAFQSGLQLWLSERLEEQRCPIAALHQPPR